MGKSQWCLRISLSWSDDERNASEDAADAAGASDSCQYRYQL